MKHENKNMGRGYSDVDTFQKKGGGDPVTYPQSNKRVISIRQVILIIIILSIVFGVWTSFLVHEITKQVSKVTTEQLICNFNKLQEKEAERRQYEQKIEMLEKKVAKLSEQSQKKQQVTKVKDNDNKKKQQQSVLLTGKQVIATNTTKKESTNTLTKKEVIQTVVDNVKFYEKPDEETKVIKSLPKGSVLEFLKEAKFGFLKVRYKGTIGYVDYSETTYSYNKEPVYRKNTEFYAVLKEKRVELKEKPKFNSETMTKLNKGDVIKCIQYLEYIREETYGWYLVEVQNTNWKGYIYGNVRKDVEMEFEISNDSDDNVEKGSEEETTKNKKTSEQEVNDSSENLIVANNVALKEVKRTAIDNIFETLESKKVEDFVKRQFQEIFKQKETVEEKEAVKGQGKGIKKLSQKGVITGNHVNFRSKPSMKGKVLTVLQKGTAVEIRKKKGNWYKITKSDQSGWMYEKYIVRKKRKGEATVGEPESRRLTVGEPEDSYFQGVKLQYSKKYKITSEPLNSKMGVKIYKGHKETYYSEKVLPGGGLKIPGRHSNTEDGTVRDKEGFICVAAHEDFMKKGTKLMTSLGPAKVYDTGCAYGTIDIYVNW